MQSSRWLVIAITLISASVGRADAQVLSRIPLALQVRVGAGIPTGSFAEQNPGIGAEPGVALEIGGVLEATPWLGVYAGYQWDRFGCGACQSVNTDDTAAASGVEGGVQLSLPWRRFGLRPWVRGGAVRHSLQFQDEQSGLRSESGVGFGVAGGLEYQIFGVRMTPGVRYQSYPVEVRFTGYPSRNLDVSHLTVDLGLTLPF